MISEKEISAIKSIFSQTFRNDMDYIVEHNINFYIVGSKCFPFINNAHDIDILITQPEIDKAAMLPILQKVFDLQHKFHFDVLFFKYENRPTVAMYLYGKYHINILGQDLPNFNLLNLQDKLWDRMNKHYIYYMKINHPKRMSDLIYYYYIINNDSYDLTEHQFQIIQSWHDGNYDWKFLKQIITELGMKFIPPKEEQL